MNKLILSLMLFLIILMLPLTNIASASHAEELIVLDKTIGKNEFNWSDEIEIIIKLRNMGHLPLENIQIVDYLPAGFSSTPNESITIELNKISKFIKKVDPDETIQLKYNLYSLGNINSDNPIQVTFPSAEIIDSNLNIIQKSNSQTVTINPNKSWVENNLILTISILLVTTFGFGSFGAIINWVNADFKTKTAREMNGTKLYHYGLLGGLAGILALAGFEGLSVVFSGTQFPLQPVPLLALVGVAISAGWAPLAVINKAVKDIQTERAQATASATIEKNEKEDYEKRINELEIKLSASDELIDAANRIERDNQILNNLIDQLRGVDNEETE